MKKLLLFSVLFILGISSCREKEGDYIPNVYVNFEINVESTQYIELNPIGGWVYLNGGYKGILIYRRAMDEFLAFERACPFDPFNDCRIQVEASPIAIDSCCMTRYLMFDGSAIEGPGKMPLKQYRTSFSPPYLYVYN